MPELAERRVDTHSPGVELHGQASGRFAGVREAFARHFRDYGEVGAAVSVTVHGEPVLDLWGGWRDAAHTQPWTADTLSALWSGTKAIAGVCFAMIVDRGLAAYEDKVSRYWPEFGAAGKADVTIGQLLSHQAGVTGFAEPATLDDLYGGEAAAARLAAQAPFWPPGAAAGYHAISVGILANALFARIEGRSIKLFVADEIARPFGVDVSIGLTAENTARAAEMIPVPGGASPLYAAGSPAQIASRNPPMAGEYANTPAWRGADLPSANGFGNARALAKLYALLLQPGADGQAIARAEVIGDATRARTVGVDLVKGVPARWAAGFSVNVAGIYGPNPDAFYHAGWGGAFALADAAAGMTIAYTMNQMGDLFDRDPRRQGLIKAVYEAF